MKTKLFLLLTVFALGIVSTVQVRTQSPDLYTLSDILPLPVQSLTRHVVLPVREDDYSLYPEKLLSLFTETADTDLARMRCSEQFIKSAYGYYLFYNAAENRYNLRLRHAAVYAQIKDIESNLAAPEKFLEGRVCKLDDGRLLLLYTVGEKSFHAEDFAYLGEELKVYAVMSDVSGKFSSPLRINDTAFGPYSACRPPVMLTGDGELYLHCQQTDSGQVMNWFYRANLEKAVSTLLDRCTFPIAASGAKRCQSIRAE